MKIDEVKIYTGEVTVSYEDGRFNLNSYTISFTDARALAAALLQIADIVEANNEN